MSGRFPAAGRQSGYMDDGSSSDSYGKSAYSSPDPPAFPQAAYSMKSVEQYRPAFFNPCYASPGNFT